jgi:2-hydroxychromene-2-carboxylate isomerase
MARIDYYFSTLSPYAYFCGTRPAEIAAKYGAELVYKPLDIMALFDRTGGQPLPERHPSRQAYRLIELARTSAKAGLPYHSKPMFFPTNAAPSSYAIIAAQKAFQKSGEGDMGGLVFSLLSACWAEEKDIAQDEVVNACLKEAGFDPALSFSGMLSGAETYSANLEEAVDAGVFGSPFFVVHGDDGAIKGDGGLFWGYDRLDDLDAYLSG